MAVTEDEIKSLVEYCETHLGDPELWTTPDEYPNSLALCIIDALYSTGSHYSSVVNVIERYKASRGTKDGAVALAQSIRNAGGARGWATSIAHNLKPANTRPGALLKAEIIEQAADLMIKHGIDTVPTSFPTSREISRAIRCKRIGKSYPVRVPESPTVTC